jgi:NAD(P)H-dependent FMN reductase
MDSRPLSIPVILGSSRKGRMSAHVGRLLATEAAKQPGVQTDLIDICSLPLPTDDAGEAIKDNGFTVGFLTRSEIPRVRV